VVAGDRGVGRVEALALDGLTNRAHVGRSRGAHRLRPEIDAVVSRLHRIVDGTVGAVHGVKARFEGAVLGPVDRLKIIPCRVVAHQLDAVHLATLELIADAPQLTTIITRDTRIRANARALGYMLA
jgi:hypothetical protein